MNDDTTTGLSDNTSGLSDQMRSDVEALTREVEKLRGDFVKLAELLRETVGHAGEEAAEQARAAGEAAWTGAKSTADELLQRIETRPVQFTAMALGLGLFLGLLFGRRS